MSLPGTHIPKRHTLGRGRHIRILAAFGAISLVGFALFVGAKADVNRQRWLEMKERERLREEMAMEVREKQRQMLLAKNSQ